MKKVIISPHSRMLRTGKQNAKNYPWWSEVVKLLKDADIYVIQIGESRQSEPQIGAHEVINDLNLKQLQEKVKETDGWMSVDNFFQHLCAFTPEKPGVVVWGISDPLIFGYPHNINLLKDRKYLRPKQFDIWENADFSKSVFVSPETVVDAVKKTVG